MTKGKDTKPGKGGKPGRKGNYEVGYGKPPRKNQFVPGQSGFKGRKRKKPEAHTVMIGRILDTKLEVGGQIKSKFEIAVEHTINQTIKSGKMSDLVKLLALMKEHGVQTETDRAAEAMAAADKAMKKISLAIERSSDIDPVDAATLERCEAGEIAIIMGCAECSAALRAGWKDPDYRALAERHSPSAIHKQALEHVQKAKRA